MSVAIHFIRAATILSGSLLRAARSVGASGGRPMCGSTLEAGRAAGFFKEFAHCPDCAPV